MNSKYPILLVHGIAIKDIKFLKAFGEIDRILKIQGYHVYKSKNDAFGSIATNALQLKEQIEEILKLENTTKVNIIAHSKGGLDSKYMIMELGMEDHVASLTTLCTPHKGSPVASGLLKLPKWMLAIINFWLNTVYRIFGDKHPNAIQVGRDLQRVDNISYETLAFSSKVYCQSFSSSINSNRYTFVDAIPYMFSRYFEKDIETDGYVPTDSAIFGNYRGKVNENESFSHSEIIDFGITKKKKKDKIYSFYSLLCEELVKMGF